METPETTPTPECPCASCGAAMAPAQDWCLECGTAAPGRLTGGPRAGFRAAATIISTVAVLVGGAVAASYAALSSEAQQAASVPAPPSATPTVVTTPQVTTTPPPTPPPPPEPAPTPPPAPAPAPPPPPPPPPPPAPTPTPPAPPAKDPAVSKPLDLGVDVAALYDPYDAALDSTDPSDSYDRNGDTVFTITTDNVDDMGVGLVFDLEQRQQVEKVYFRTDTPGFTVEIYAARDKLPPDILDNRWKLLETAKDAGAEKGADGLEKIVLEPGEHRYVLLWLTTPPPVETAEGAPPPEQVTVGFSEVRILD